MVHFLEHDFFFDEILKEELEEVYATQLFTTDFCRRAKNGTLRNTPPPMLFGIIHNGDYPRVARLQKSCVCVAASLLATNDHMLN